MTVETDTNVATGIGNGATTVFPYNFLVFTADTLSVTFTDPNTGVVTTVPPTDYFISGLGNAEGGSVIFNAAPADNIGIIIKRTVPNVQPLDLINQSGFYPDTLERQLDLTVMQIQQLNEITGRAIVVPVGESGVSLPSAEERAGMFPVFLPDGSIGTSFGTGADLGLRQDIASTDSDKGADLVASTGPVGSPAYLQTLSDIEAGNPVSLYRFVPSANIAAIRDFTSVYDVTEVIDDAIGNGVQRFIAEYGLFNFESSIVTDAPLAIHGAGEGTIFVQRSVSSKATFEWKSASDAEVIEGIDLRDFVLKCETGTFAEQQHLIEVNGVANANFERLRLIGFRGDGIYLGSGIGEDERHNRNVAIRRCLFDGVNNENRNGVSVIDCDGIFIEQNRFYRCTKSTMPGPIDFEPNANAWHLVRGVRVRDNIFTDCGGNVGEVSFLAPSAVTLAPQDIEVSGNHSSGYAGTGAFLLYDANRDFTATGEDSDVRVTGNRVDDGAAPFAISNGKKVAFAWNRWSDCTESARLGLAAEGAVRDVTMLGDRFTRCASVAGTGLNIFAIAGLDMQKVAFDDCGTGSAGTSNAMRFVSGASSKVHIDELDVTAPTAKTLVAIQKEAAHTFTPATNSLRRARLGSLGNFFQAEDSDRLMSAYPTATPPIIEGGSSVGTGTYAESFGRFRCDGDWVIGHARFSVTTHDGSGPIEVSLPRPAAAGLGSTAMRTLGAWNITGLASINGPVEARLNSSAAAGGNQGAIRFYTVAAGVEALVNMPGAGNAFIVEGAFAYMAVTR